MKKILLIAAVLFATMAMQAKGGKTEKVKVWHNGHVIEVSENALKAHLGHGDEVMVFYNDVWMPESEYERILEELAELDKDYEEVGAESEDVEGEEDVEEY